MPLLAALQQRAQRLKAEILALYLAARHPGTPWYAKLFMAGIVAYAFSPIDLIPDFVPILGYLDDLILLPLGIALAIKMVPPAVWAECRARAQAGMLQGNCAGYVAGVVIVVLWVALAALGFLWAYRASMSVPSLLGASLLPCIAVLTHRQNMVEFSGQRHHLTLEDAYGSRTTRQSSAGDRRQ